MDIVNLIYYASVCGLLACLAPNLKSAISRIICGVVVGVLAASLLPYLKSAFGQMGV